MVLTGCVAPEAPVPVTTDMEPMLVMDALSVDMAERVEEKEEEEEEADSSHADESSAIASVSWASQYGFR